jgi:GT2 family glycosyltransferase
MISVLIVNWNRAALTRMCLESLRQNTTGVSYEIIVVDNGSNVDQLEQVRDCCTQFEARLIELGHNVYFGEANNIAAEAARGEILLLLNNDVVVPAGYVEPLLNTLSQAYSAGAVGPKFVYPDGQLQEAGAYVRSDGWPIQHGKENPPVDLISSNGPHIVDYCSAACLMIRREVFLEAGGFDPMFDPAYFEDVDLMLRLRSTGLFTYLCTDVTVIHYENTTSREVWDQKRFEAVLGANHQRFTNRWGSYVSRRLFEEVEMPTFRDISWTPAPAAARSTAAVVIHGPGQVQHNQAWLYIIALAAKVSANHNVVLAPEVPCSRCRVLTLAREAGVVFSNFSIMRESDVELRPEDTMISVRWDRHQALELSSGTGPHVDSVRMALRAAEY